MVPTAIPISIHTFRSIQGSVQPEKAFTFVAYILNVNTIHKHQHEPTSEK